MWLAAREQGQDQTCLVIKKTKYTLDKIILLKENLPEPTLTTGVILKIELIKAMKSTLVCMNIQKVNIQIIPVQTNVRRDHKLFLNKKI